MGSDHGLQVVRRCAINGQAMTRVICDEFSRTEIGNEVCTERKCNSPFRVCPVCIEQATFEELVIIGSESYVDRSGYCHNHAKDRNADILELPAIKRKMMQHEKKMDKSAPVISDDDEESLSPDVAAEEAVRRALEKNGGLADETIGLSGGVAENAATEKNADLDATAKEKNASGLFNERDVVTMPIDKISLSELVPLHFFHNEELDLIETEMRCIKKYAPLRVVRRKEGVQAISGFGYWQVATKTGVKTLRVIIEQAKDERYEFLVSAIENLRLYCSFELSVIASKLKGLFPELSDDELASKFDVPDAVQWFQNLLKLQSLHPRLQNLMHPSIEPRKRLELGTVVKLGLFNLSDDEQRKMANRIITVKKIDMELEVLEEAIPARSNIKPSDADQEIAVRAEEGLKVPDAEAAGDIPEEQMIAEEGAGNQLITEPASDPVEAPAAKTDELGVCLVKASSLHPSSKGPRHLFHEDELNHIRLELRKYPAYPTLWVMEREGKLEVVRGEGVRQAALKEKIDELRVKVVNFPTERDEFLSLAVENHKEFCTWELFEVLQKIRGLYSQEEYSDKQIAECFKQENAAIWYRNVMRIKTLHPKLLKLMHPAIQPSKRLELAELLKYRLMDRTVSKQISEADDWMRSKKIVLTPEIEADAKAFGKEVKVEDNRTAGTASIAASQKNIGKKAAIAQDPDSRHCLIFDQEVKASVCLGNRGGVCVENKCQYAPTGSDESVAVNERSENISASATTYETLKQKLEKRLNDPDAKGRLKNDLADFLKRYPDVLAELGFKREGRKFRKITAPNDRRSSKAVSIPVQTPAAEVSNEAPAAAAKAQAKSVRSKKELVVVEKSFEALKKELSEKLNEVGRTGRFPLYLAKFADSHPEVVTELGFRKYRKQYKKIKSANIQTAQIRTDEDVSIFENMIEGGFCSTVELVNMADESRQLEVEKAQEKNHLRVELKTASRVFACFGSELTGNESDEELELALENWYDNPGNKGSMPVALRQYLERRPAHLPKIVRATDPQGRRRMMMVKSSGEKLQEQLQTYLHGIGHGTCPPIGVFDFLKRISPLLIELAGESGEVKELHVERIVSFEKA